MSVDHENNTVTCDINDSKDMQLTADFLANNEGFSVVGQDNNKGSSLSFSNADEFNEYRANPLTGGIKVGYSYDSGTADISDNWLMNILRAFAGFDCTGGDFFVGAYIEGPSMNFGQGVGIDTSLLSANVILGLRDSAFALEVFAYASEISGHIDFPIPFSTHALRFEVSKYPGSYGIGGSIGLNTSLRFGFGIGYGGAVKLVQQ